MNNKKDIACPHCGWQLVDWVAGEDKYCGRCGKKIADALADALAEIDKDND